MGLPNFRMFLRRPPSNYGGAAPQPLQTLYLATVCLALALLAWLLTAVPAGAQSASQPGFDARQTEKYFDDQQNRPARPGERPNVRMPQFERPEASNKPLFVLRGVSIQG